MQIVRPAISTLCIGQASSIAALLLMAGHKDMRFALPNARIMLHQPFGGFQGQASDILLHAQEILNLKNRLNAIYAKHTGCPIEKIEEALERDMFLSADGAVEFGIVDQVLLQRSELLECRAPLLNETAVGVGCLPKPPTLGPVTRAIRPTIPGIARENVGRICAVTTH
jgi:ATP-dependent Clp protease, protease subunit